MLNFSVAPYFEDFKDEKDFYKILFRPGFPVQARELTQIQSILQNQVKKFGDHIFKNGSMVIPGNVSHDLSVKAIRITLDDSAYDVSGLIGSDIIGSSNEVKMHVVHAEKTGANAIVFAKTISNSPTDPLVDYIEDSSSVEKITAGGNIPFGTTISTGSFTPATIGYINDGIYYINGYFVNVKKQQCVLSSTSAAPTCVVGLKLVEEIITESDDPDLLDPASGSSNENAPGAHRQKISLVLESYATQDQVPTDFIILFKLEDGELIKLVDSSTYNELMTTLARRTYEESGNYIVAPYDIQLKEQSPISDSLNLFVSKGISFVGGYEIDNRHNRLTEVIPKSRSTNFVNNSLNRVNIGNYLYVTDCFALPKTWGYIEFRDDTIATPGTPVGNIIGFAKVRAVEKTAVANVYKVFIFGAEFKAGSSIQNAASIVQVDSAGATAKTSANIVAVYTVSNVNGVFNTTNEITSQSVATNVVVAIPGASGFIYAKKKAGAYNWLKNGEVVKQTTSNATASIVATVLIQEPSSAVPIMKFPKSAVKTAADFNYYVTRQISLTLTGASSVHSPLGVGETFSSPTTAAVWKTTTGAFLTATFTEGATSVTITGGAAADQVILTVNVRKGTAIQKSKTKTADSLVVADPSNKSKISLGRNDVTKLVSVMNGSVNVTSRYALKSNQKDGEIGSSYIELMSGASAPTTSITINFEYLVNSSGDFATVDSYTSLGTTADFISQIPTYKSTSGGTFVLEDCVDFRPTAKVRSYIVKGSATSGNTTFTLGTGYSNGQVAAGDTIYGQGVNTTVASVPTGSDVQVTLTGAPTATNTNGIFIVGFDPTSYSGIASGTAEAVAAATNFVCDYEYYLPRVDVVCLTNKGDLELFQGIPAEVPEAPVVVESEFRMKLANLIIPAYTFAPVDVIIGPFNRKRYTMADIGSIDHRVSVVEEMTALNMLETQLASSQIIDPVTGLNRFKSGFVVDNFGDHSVIDLSDTTLAMLDYETNSMTCLKDGSGMNLITIESESTGYVDKNGMVMLPYTEEVLVDQPMATRPQNVNPFAVFKWNGTLTLTPASDFWVDTRRLADITVTVNGNTGASTTVTPALKYFSDEDTSNSIPFTN